MGGYSFDPDADTRDWLDNRTDEYCYTCGLSWKGQERIRSFGFKADPCTNCLEDYP